MTNELMLIRIKVRNRINPCNLTAASLLAFLAESKTRSDSVCVF